MFGEDVLLGNSQTNLDHKGRLFLPVNTKREVGENLILLYDSELNIYRLYSDKMIKKEFERINNKIKNATNRVEELEYKRKSYEFSKSIIKSCKVDGNGRITVGNLFDKNEINLIGDYDNLIIEKVKKM